MPMPSAAQQSSGGQPAATAAATWVEQLAADSFGAYSRLWVVSEVVGLVMEPFCVPDQRWLFVLGPALALAFLAPTRGSLGVTLTLRIAMSAHQAPYHFDSAIWKMQTDLAVLLAVALHERDHAMAACSWVVQGQMSLFYLASGFWKINTAFLDHRASCAPILFLALLEYLPPPLTPLVLTRFLTVIAPWTTIIGEMAIGVLVLGNLTMQCLGVALAVVLHFMIAITPFPNQIPTFGVYCLVRLFFSLPKSWSTAQAEICAMPLRLGRDGASTIKVAGMALGLAVAAKLNSNPAFNVNWAIVLYFALTYISMYALYLEATVLKPKRKPAREAAPSTGYRLVGWLLLALALLYSFGFQVLGLMEMSLANPFASLRMHGGSNHLFMPTALLQQTLSTDSELGGGVVRVESCTSDFINALYPGESTANLSPRLRVMLTESGHIGRQFAPSVRNALGAEIRKYMPPNGDPFVPYTTTSYELRRILGQARDNNETFSIQYTVRRLPSCTSIIIAKRSGPKSILTSGGLVHSRVSSALLPSKLRDPKLMRPQKLSKSLGDETWRAKGTGVTFFYESKPGWSQCHRVIALENGRAEKRLEQGTAAYRMEPCTADEMAMQELPPPQGLLGKMLINFGYAIIPELELIGELPCYD